MRANVAHLALLSTTLLLGCEPEGDLCVPYEGDRPELCAQSLCVPDLSEVVAMPTFVSYQPQTAPTGEVQISAASDVAGVRLTFGDAVRDDASEASLRAHLRDGVYVRGSVGNFGLSDQEIYVGAVDAVIDELSKDGDSVRVRGSYVGEFANYLVDPPVPVCDNGLQCRPQCDYEGELTTVTFDITFEWPL